MDPMTISALIGAGSSLLSAGMKGGPASQPPPPQRSDGYAMGGYADSSSPNTMGSGATGGATGGAYGGAYSQSNVDGSNWVVSTGKSNAVGGGKSGENGGFAPSQSNAMGGVSPASPFNMGAGMSGVTGQLGGSPALLIGLALVALLILKRKG